MVDIVADDTVCVNDERAAPHIIPENCAEFGSDSTALDVHQTAIR